jgi:Uma2 family endonuclease
LEGLKLRPVADLIAGPEERAELIDGEIVRRPMTPIDHGTAQSDVSDELGPLKRRGGPDGWWIATEVGVAYKAHQCPSHDLAGWRTERLPERPSGIMGLIPDRVCEIVSPGYERKDTLTLLLLLQHHQVPFYWLLWPESRAVIAYALEAGQYRSCASISEPTRVRVPPLEEIELDLGYILGE